MTASAAVIFLFTSDLAYFIREDRNFSRKVRKTSTTFTDEYTFKPGRRHRSDSHLASRRQRPRTQRLAHVHRNQGQILATLVAVTSGGSLRHVFVQKAKHVGLPNIHAEIEEVVSIVKRVTDWRIDLQAMWLTDLLAASVHYLA